MLRVEQVELNFPLYGASLRKSDKNLRLRVGDKNIVSPPIYTACAAVGCC